MKNPEPAAIHGKIGKNAVALIFDDHLLFAESFSALIRHLNIFHSIHTPPDEQTLIRLIPEHTDRPIYVFLDYYLKNNTGLSLIAEIRRKNKQAIIIVTSSVISPTAIAQIMQHRPRGIVSKSSGIDTIIKCIAEVSRGGHYNCPIIDDVITRHRSAGIQPFTVRELEILQYFTRGLSIAETAEEACLSIHTIVAHRRNMMNKAGVNSITELLAYARTKELIEKPIP